MSALLATACGDDEEPDGFLDGDEAADDANDEGLAVGKDLADLAEDDLRGQAPDVVVSRIGAILVTLDVGEIEQAKAELELGSDPEALGFAAQMRDMHSVHDERVDDLLDRRRLSPLGGAAADALHAEATAGLDQLSARPPSDVDFKYLRLQVRMHTAGERLVDDLIDLAPDDDDELLDFLTATRDEIVDHRREAEAILRAW